MKVYIYNEDVSPIKKVAAWPGVEMTSEGDNLYSYTLNDWPLDAYVIFTDGRSQIPASGQKGYKLTSGSSMIYNNGSWSAYVLKLTSGSSMLYNNGSLSAYVPEVKDPTVSSSKEDCTFTDSLSLKLAATNYTSATYSINGALEVAYTNGTTITIGKDAVVGDKITVALKATNGTTTVTNTYIYTKIQELKIEALRYIATTQVAGGH